jgi:quinol monooxygenase YgiN
VYGTIMRARAKPGARETIEQWLASLGANGVDPEGFHSSQLAWEDADPNRLVLIVHFRDKATYLANAGSPEQDAEYRRMLEYLEGEPEWIDVHYAGYQGRPLP